MLRVSYAANQASDSENVNELSDRKVSFFEPVIAIDLIGNLALSYHGRFYFSGLAVALDVRRSQAHPRWPLYDELVGIFDMAAEFEPATGGPAPTCFVFGANCRF